MDRSVVKHLPAMCPQTCCKPTDNHEHWRKQIKKTYIKQQQQKPEEGVGSTIYPQDSFADYTARMKPCSAHLHESGLPVL